MSLRTIVLCAGYGTRGRTDFQINKLAFPINGEPLLSRSFRIIKECGLFDVWAVLRSNVDHQTIENDRIIPYNITRYATTGEHKNSFVEMLNTKDLWQGDTLILLGDLVFSKRALQYMIATWKGPLTIFGWGQKEGVTPVRPKQFCGHGEVFAVKIRGFHLEKAKAQLSALPLKFYDLWNVVYQLKINMVQVTECKDLDSKEDLENTPKLFRGL